MKAHDVLLDYAYQTVCGKRPELCEPRNIKMVCFDADDTIWNIYPNAIASSIGGPFKKIDNDTVEGTTGGGYPLVQRPRKVTIKLKSTFRQTLDKLDEKGISSSIISLNTPGTVKRIIAAFGLSERFTDIEDTWQNKGDVFADITKRHKINPCSALFIDDSIRHVEDVSAKGGLALVIGKNGDVQEPIELLSYIDKG